MSPCGEIDVWKMSSPSVWALVHAPCVRNDLSHPSNQTVTHPSTSWDLRWLAWAARCVRGIEVKVALQSSWPPTSAPTRLSPPLRPFSLSCRPPTPSPSPSLGLQPGITTKARPRSWCLQSGCPRG